MFTTWLKEYINTWFSPSTYDLTSSDSLENTLKRLGLEHDVLHEIVGQIVQVDLAHFLGEVNLLGKTFFRREVRNLSDFSWCFIKPEVLGNLSEKRFLEEK